MTPRVGVALGGGGAKGLAHLSMLQVLDDLGVRPHAISGTSIGAILGALYASGMKASEVRRAVDELLAMPGSYEEFIESKRSFGWMDLLGLEFGRSHLLEANAFLEELDRLIGVKDFDELAIPLRVVAADFWKRQPAVFDTGAILSAVEASFALPGVFRPVVHEGRVLVDGGCVNPVPFDLLQDDCDIVIAVDVLGKRVPQDDLMPSFGEALFNTFQIAEKTIVEQKMRRRPPDIFIEPAIHNVKVLEFQKRAEIYRESEPEARRLAAELKQKLAGYDGR